MNWQNPEADEPINPTTANEFWLIILESWMMEEVVAWKEYGIKVLG